MLTLLLFALILAAIGAPFLAGYLLARRFDSRLGQLVGLARTAEAFASNMRAGLESVGGGLAAIGEGLKREYPRELALHLKTEAVAAEMPVVPDHDPPPASVMEYVKAWDSKWAQDAELKTLRRLRGELGSWDKALEYKLMKEPRPNAEA